MQSVYFAIVGVVIAVTSYVQVSLHRKGKTQEMLYCSQIAAMEAFAERYLRRLRVEYFRAAIHQQLAWYDQQGTATVANCLNE